MSETVPETTVGESASDGEPAAAVEPTAVEPTAVEPIVVGESAAVVEPARWRDRAIALALDVFPGLAVMITMSMLALCFPFGSGWRWCATAIAALAFLAIEVNRILLPAERGSSLGRAFAGIELVRGDPDPGSQVGAVRLLLREVAHLLDTAPLMLGWIWPLRDRRGRTFADLLARTEASPARRERPSNVRFRAMLVSVIAASLCAAAAIGGYAGVYRRDHSSDRVRAQISVRGPRIVADMLSYDPTTLQDDFQRAQSLATEKYREQLVPQQDAIRNAKPVPNYYRVTDAAVLQAAPHRATMLLFLQGQRGIPGQERLISATVQVVFVESKGTWRVDDLSVVSKPLPAEGDK